jgi:GT2 family glycosyltransferase
VTRSVSTSAAEERPEPAWSVIIASSNRRENLEFALRGLALQTTSAFDVVVVDDGSRDGTRELVEELCSTRRWSGGRLRWVSTGVTPRGLSRARNVGVGNAAPTATHVVTLDADVVLERRALDRLARASGRHPTAAAFGVVNWLPADARRAVATALRRGRPERLGELVPEAVPTRVDGTIVGPDPRRVEAFSSADEARPAPLEPALALNTFCAIPLSVVDGIGGWDEALVGYGYEDMELGARLRRQGTAALYVADAVGYHLWHPKNWPAAALEAERNLDYVLRRLGADAVSDAYADWTVWWHYHRDREGTLWSVDDRHYALNRGRTHGLLLSDRGWIARLGYGDADVRAATEADLASIELVGRPRDLAVSRFRNVEAFRDGSGPA